MPAPEYPEAALEYVQAQGWTTNLTELRDGAYIVAGSREVDSGSEKMFLMVVCDPEPEVTTEHVKYLVKAAKQKNANAAALTADVGATGEAQQAIEESPVSVINADRVTSKTGTQTAGSPSQSVSEHDEQTQKDAYEIYGSRSRMVLIGIGGLVLGFGAIAILLDGYSEGWKTLLVILGIPLFIGGGIVMFYQAIKHDPLLRITDDGISYIKPIGTSEFYPWGKIEQVSRVEQKTKGGTQVHLQIQVAEIENESALSDISTQLNKAAIGDDSDAQYIPMSSYGLDFEEIAEAVEQFSDVPVTADL